VIQTPPTWPNRSNLKASRITQTEATLSWTAATDESGIAEYKLIQVGTGIEYLVTGNTLKYTVTGLSPATSYTFKVEAKDAFGNWSNNGPQVTFTTAAPKGKKN
jgi:chitodextrinase